MTSNDTRKQDLADAKAWLCARWHQKHPNEQHIIQLADYAAHLRATPKPPAGGDAEEKGWDHRYRRLAWGEVILDTDECRRDDGTWVTGICVGQKAPDPAYTSHRVYRRLVEPAGDDAEERYRQALEDVCNPIGYLQRLAEAEGAKLSGMAYSIATDISTVQSIARDALNHE